MNVFKKEKVIGKFFKITTNKSCHRLVNMQRRIYKRKVKNKHLELYLKKRSQKYKISSQIKDKKNRTCENQNRTRTKLQKDFFFVFKGFIYV